MEIAVGIVGAMAGLGLWFAGAIATVYGTVLLIDKMCSTREEAILRGVQRNKQC